MLFLAFQTGCCWWFPLFSHQREYLFFLLTIPLFIMQASQVLCRRTMGKYIHKHLKDVRLNLFMILLESVSYSIVSDSLRLHRL